MDYFDYYEVTVRWGEPSLARLAQALIICKGAVTDSYALGRLPETPKGVRGAPVDIVLMVRLPAGKGEQFKQRCRPEDMRRPPDVHLNTGARK